MFSRMLTQKSTASCWDQAGQLKQVLEEAEAVLVGAGAGLSAAAGLTYSGERFERYFQDFASKYGIQDMYSGGFYPFASREESWAWWSRQIMINRYVRAPKPVYQRLLEWIGDKDYFILTTNVDHQFQLAGFEKKRLFYTQGDYGLWQCSGPCHQSTYDNEEAVRRMQAEQRDMKVPSQLVPYCPHCGRPMAMNLRTDDRFVQDDGWYQAAGRYQDFLRCHRGRRMVLLELGVGGNTPAVIKYPFWEYTSENPNAVYVCINTGWAFAPKAIADRAVCINCDIGAVLDALASGSCTGEVGQPHTGS